MNHPVTVLVTGGAGYIGATTAHILKRQGYRPVIFDNLVYGHREFVGDNQFYEGDLASPKDLKEVFEQEKIDAVMHFAAYAYVGESVENPRKYYANNAVGALNLLNTMLDHSVKRFIFSSTCATYGNPLHVPIREDHPQNPVNPYGFSKSFIERVLRDYDIAYGLKAVNLRYFNASGADPDSGVGEDHDPETHLIPLALDAAMGRRNSLSIFGSDYPTPDGTCIRDYIHVSDLADAHVLALQKLLQGGGSDFFNLGIGKGFSVRKVIETAEQITGKKIKTVEVGRRAGDPAELVSDSAKAYSVLGWKPRYTDITDIVSTAWQWHQKRFRDSSL